MKNSIILNIDQIKRLQSEQTLTVSMPIPEKYIINEEPERYKLHYLSFAKDSGAFFEDLKPEITPWISPIPFPYAVGQSIYVREKWGDIDFGEGEKCLMYKVDEENNPDSLINSAGYGDCFSGWQSPATMPKEAARLFPVVQKIECKQVRSLDGGDLEGLNLLYKCIQCHGWGHRMAGGDSVECDNILCGSEQGDIHNIINHFGQASWDNNDWVFLIELKIDASTCSGD